MISFNKDKDIKTVDENVRKVLKINKDVSIGYAGDPLALSMVLEELDSFDYKRLSLGQVKKILVDKMKSLYTNEIGIKIIISGRNKYGKMLMYVLERNRECKIEKYEPMPSRPVFSCAGQDYNTVVPIMNKYIINTFPWSDMLQLRDYMIKCVQEVSKVDKSVNDNIHEVVIM